MFFISGEGEGRKVFMGSLLFLRTQEPDRKMYVALASTQSELISQNTRCKTDNLDEIYLMALHTSLPSAVICTVWVQEMLMLCYNKALVEFSFKIKFRQIG